MSARIEGRLTLRVRGPQGALLTERRARNLVLRSGASAVAALFAGGADAGPIDAVGVGFAREAATPETAALTAPETDIPAEALRAALTPQSFQVAIDLPGVVRVSISAVFTPSVELVDVTEAGLFAGGRLYNQVVFEPVTLRPDQDVTFFWEVDFPFGH